MFLVTLMKGEWSVKNVFLFLFAVVIAAVFTADSDARCGKASRGNRVGLLERVNNHRHLRADHRSHNVTARRGVIVVVPAQKAAPKAKKAL